MKYEPLYVSTEVSIEATMVDILVIYYHILWTNDIVCNMTKGSATVYTVLKIFNWYVLAEVGQRQSSCDVSNT